MSITLTPSEQNVFTPLSNTGQLQVLAGYGLGNYGDSGYGQNYITISVNNTLMTTWSNAPTK